MLPDLLVESENGERIVWQATTLKSFIRALNVTATPLAVPHSCAFVNIRGGTAAGEESVDHEIQCYRLVTCHIKLFNG